MERGLRGIENWDDPEGDGKKQNRRGEQCSPVRNVRAIMEGKTC